MKQVQRTPTLKCCFGVTVITLIVSYVVREKRLQAVLEKIGNFMSLGVKLGVGKQEAPLGGGTVVYLTAISCACSSDTDCWNSRVQDGLMCVLS